MSSIKDSQPEDRTEAISLATISGFAETRGLKIIDFLKIDTEGYDLEVLAGAGPFYGNKTSISFLPNANRLALQTVRGFPHIGGVYGWVWLPGLWNLRPDDGARRRECRLLLERAICLRRNGLTLRLKPSNSRRQVR